jgi:hypothetical protein
LRGENHRPIVTILLPSILFILLLLSSRTTTVARQILTVTVKLTASFFEEGIGLMSIELLQLDRIEDIQQQVISPP